MMSSFLEPRAAMSKSANDNDVPLEAGLVNLPRIAQVVHDHPPDVSSKVDDAAVRSYKPSRESIMLMHGELDGGSTNEAQKMSSESTHSNNPRPSKTAPGASPCCITL
jgi:hypothetical protein